MTITRNSEFIVVGTICPLTMPDEMEILTYGLVVRVGDMPHMATIVYVSLGQNILTSQSFVTAAPGYDLITIHYGLWSSLLTSQIADPISEIGQATLDMVSRYSGEEDPNIEPEPELNALMSVVRRLLSPVLDFELENEDPPRG